MNRIQAKEEMLINEFAFDIRKAISDSLHVKKAETGDEEVIEVEKEAIAKTPIEEKAKALAEKIKSIVYYEGVTRIFIAVVMLVVFVILNYYVINDINKAVDFDMEAIRAKLYGPEHRLITEKVYISLITGVVVEASAVFFTIVKFIFRNDQVKSSLD